MTSVGAGLPANQTTRCIRITAFAGKPAPTEIVQAPQHLCSTQHHCRSWLASEEIVQAPQHLCSTQHHCRSWLASEEGVSATDDVGYAAAFAGKPAPTGAVSHINPTYAHWVAVRGA